jgi:aminomethyltransferase
MTVLDDIHADHGATFTDRNGHRAVSHYGRPERTHRAVRAGVGVMEAAVGVVTVTGDDRIDYVDNAISNRVPADDEHCRYAFLLDPSGRVRTDMLVCNAGDKLLLFTPPGEARPLADDWSEKIFIEDVTVRAATDEFAVFDVHGPKATEKIASVFTGTAAPEERFSFTRGTLGDTPATVIRTDAPTGEESFSVVCGADGAPDTFDTLINRGTNAAPFGYRTYDWLTLEAGTPQFATELHDSLATDTGVRSALDFEKGCFVGQEVISRIENRGHPGQRLVGLEPESVPEAGAAVHEGTASVGAVTRAAHTPSADRPIALAAVDFDAEGPFEVAGADGDIPATVAPLPFVEGSERSGRLPGYEQATA